MTVDTMRHCGSWLSIASDGGPLKWVTNASPSFFYLPQSGIDGVGNPPSLPEFVAGRRVAQPIRLD